MTPQREWPKVVSDDYFPSEATAAWSAGGEGQPQLQREEWDDVVSDGATVLIRHLTVSFSEVTEYVGIPKLTAVLICCVVLLLTLAVAVRLRYRKYFHVLQVVRRRSVGGGGGVMPSSTSSSMVSSPITTSPSLAVAVETPKRKLSPTPPEREVSLPASSQQKQRQPGKRREMESVEPEEVEEEEDFSTGTDDSSDEVST